MIYAETTVTPWSSAVNRGGAALVRLGLETWTRAIGSGGLIRAAATPLSIHAHTIDYVLVIVYFVTVLGIGVLSRRSVSSSLDFLLSGRSLPAWVTGLAFMSANLGATELLGQTANGAQYGMETVHYYWVGAIPAMVFLGLVMMPFYYGAKVRSVPEFLARRFNPATQRFQAVLFSVATVLVSV